MLALTTAYALLGIALLSIIGLFVLAHIFCSDSRERSKLPKMPASLVLAKLNGLDWVHEWDENDNSVWSAASCYTSDDEGSAPFFYRLRQELRGNKHVWVEAHDAELLQADGAREWHYLHEAKSVLNREHLEDVAREQEAT